MLLGFLKAPHLLIEFQDQEYAIGDRLDVVLRIETSRPGQKVRRGVVELVLESRYTQIRTGMALDPRAGAAAGPVIASPFSPSRTIEQRVDRDVQARHVFMLDGELKHRRELFQVQFIIKKPPVRRTTESRANYMVSVHMDIPRMRDIEVHRTVPVRLA